MASLPNGWTKVSTGYYLYSDEKGRMGALNVRDTPMNSLPALLENLVSDIVRLTQGESE